MKKKKKSTAKKRHYCIKCGAKKLESFMIIHKLNNNGKHQWKCFSCHTENRGFQINSKKKK